MKNEKDFRSGFFEIRYLGFPLCDLLLFPAGSTGFLKNQPSFEYVTQLAPPPSPIVSKTDSTSYSAASALGLPPLNVEVTQIQPARPLDQLGMLISLLDMAVTAAQPPKDDRVPRNTVSIMPFSGVKTSISLPVARPSKYALTYQDILLSVRAISADVARGETWILAAIRAKMHLDGVFQWGAHVGTVL